MTSDDIEISDEYAKGFNQGYIIAKYEPSLAKELAKVEKDNPWFEGFQDGKKQVVHEKLQEQKKNLQKDYDRSKPTPDKSKGRDKDIER